MGNPNCGFKVDPTSWEIKRKSGQGLGLGVSFEISQKKNGCETVTNFSHTLLCNHTTSGLHLEFNLGTTWEGFPSPSAAAGRFRNPVLHESCAVWEGDLRKVPNPGDPD